MKVEENNIKDKILDRIEDHLESCWFDFLELKGYPNNIKKTFVIHSGEGSVYRYDVNIVKVSGGNEHE